MILKGLERVLRRMFGALVTVSDKVVDPWDGSGNYYVSIFRKQLDEIAASLSRADRVVRTRFDPDIGCVELHVPLGEVIAQVVVHGEMCSPETAIITPLSLPEGARELFVKMLPLPVEFRAAT